MPSIAPILAAHGNSQRQLARSSGQSLAAINAIVKHGEWPKRATAAVRHSVVSALRQLGATTAELRGIALPARTTKKAPGAPTPEADPPAETINPNPEEEPMLMRNQPLHPLARERFKLPRDPFTDDVQCRADVYATQHARYVRQALMSAATGYGFLAVIGESGSGKSTLREELEERIREERKSVILVKPYARESGEARKPLRSSHVEAAFFRALAPGLPRRSNPDDRVAQIHDLLVASHKAGYSHMLVIEEAHRLPITTLKNLKNFTELKDGLRRILSVCLIGQPELRDLLSEQNPEIREIVQRCEQIDMRPLDADLEGYLHLKFQRVGVELKDVLAPDAVEAIRARLIKVPRGGRITDAVSVCYPLVVNNLVSRALNTAAAAGWDRVTAEVIAEC
jgi:type II secretory pathway predicted ATPase ExeA